MNNNQKKVKVVISVLSIAIIVLAVFVYIGICERESQKPIRQWSEIR